MTKVYNRENKKFKRRTLRRNIPLSEVVLWSKLKDKGLGGYKFRRQYSIGKFVIDFYCPKLKLAIEVDGGSHFVEGADVCDKERQTIIETFGITFLRFTNREIHENIEGVLNKIMEYMQTPTRPPLSKGRLRRGLKGIMFLKSKRGFTLIEIIIVIVILSIVSAITIYFLINSLKVYTMTVNQKTLLDEGKLALERMCRDIRDARVILQPNAGNSSNRIIFRRTNATAQDSANERIIFRLIGNTLQKDKASPNVTADLAVNVSTFTVTREATNDEITLQLTLSLGSGENVTLQTKVYPKNLAESSTYKNFRIQDSGGNFTSWKEEISS